VRGWWIDAGTPESLLRASTLVAESAETSRMATVS
jgi:dTDP-glucose pyrophosphorylase